MRAAPQRGRGRRAATRLCAAALVVSAGCAPERSSGSDAGASRVDAELVEGGLERDAALASEAGDVLDADAQADGGEVSACGGPCDPSGPTSGCVGAGLACVLRDRTPACVLGDGALLEGAPCVDPEACAPGLACFAEPAGGGRCARVCCAQRGDACSEGAVCRGDGVLVGGVPTAWAACLPPQPCALFATDGACGAREACYVVSADGVTECRVAGDAPLGAPCETWDACAPGLVCAGLVTPQCLALCAVADPAACPDGERCTAQAYSPPGTGVCLGPPR